MCGVCVGPDFSVLCLVTAWLWDRGWCVCVACVCVCVVWCVCVCVRCVSVRCVWDLISLCCVWRPPGCGPGVGRSDGCCS